MPIPLTVTTSPQDPLKKQKKKKYNRRDGFHNYSSPKVLQSQEKSQTQFLFLLFLEVIWIRLHQDTDSMKLGGWGGG